MSWRFAHLASLIAILSCNKPSTQPLKRLVTPGGPQVQATVVTIRTTLQPENKTTTSTIVIGDDAARATEEIGTWRLFDFKQSRVAFVDDFAKTYRYESLQSLVQRRDAANSAELNEKLPRAEYSVTGAQRPVLGVPATQSLVKLGAYERELWFGTHPLIPEQLFALMHASETPSVDAPIAKKPDEALLAARGFPLLDHAELPYAQTKIVVDRDVVEVGRRNVAESLLQIPESYKQLRPRPPVEVTKPKPVVPTTTETTATTGTTPAPAAVAPQNPATTATVAPPPVEKPKPVVKPKPIVKKKAPTTKKAPVKKAPAKAKKKVAESRGRRVAGSPGRRVRNPVTR